MSRIAYVNGRYLPHAAAAVHVEDRGYQFADGVYEVTQIARGALIDLTAHLDRLERSLDELRMEMPLSRAALEIILREVMRRNRIINGMVYLQITRGQARRDHAFPLHARPSLVVTARAVDPLRFERLAQTGVGVLAFPDLRWKRVDIKTVNLTANVLARQQARESGAFEAWLVDDDGFVTEGAATNAWIVLKNGSIVTRNTGPEILAGVTRQTLIRQIEAKQIRLELRAFTLEEAMGAAEAFITGATLTVMPVVSINEQIVGAGRPGPVATALRADFAAFAEGGNSPGGARS